MLDNYLFFNGRAYKNIGIYFYLFCYNIFHNGISM